MPVCEVCKREMGPGVSCILEAYNSEPPRIRHVGTEDCDDCGCPPSGLHHPGCDVERCPICGGQVISCSCGRENESE